MFSAQVFSTVFGIASGPSALFGLRSLRSLATPASDVWIHVGNGGGLEGWRQNR